MLAPESTHASCAAGISLHGARSVPPSHRPPRRTARPPASAAGPPAPPWRRRVPLRSADRFLWIVRSRVWSRWRDALILVKPETVVAWHRRGFRCSRVHADAGGGHAGAARAVRRVRRRRTPRAVQVDEAIRRCRGTRAARLSAPVQSCHCEGYLHQGVPQLRIRRLQRGTCDWEGHYDTAAGHLAVMGDHRCPRHTGRDLLRPRRAEGPRLVRRARAQRYGGVPDIDWRWMAFYCDD